MASDKHLAWLPGVAAWNAWREKDPLQRSKRQGLCKLPPDAIVKARDDTAAQINRILITFVGTVLFCVLSLLTPDSALLTGGEKLNLPGAGPVSFFGFMLLGPLVLFVLRGYLQIYVDHRRRLDRVTQSIPTARRTSILTPDTNPAIRSFRGFTLYLLLPLAMLAFWWKAAVFAAWGFTFPIFVTCASAGSLASLFPRRPRRLRAAISLGVIILGVVVTLSFGPFTRPFSLFRANLADQWLVDTNLAGAFLARANLERAALNDADLSNADLSHANLANADLRGAKLSGANFMFANLVGAQFYTADGDGANFNSANLTNAELLTSNFNGANFAAAKLTGADLRGAKFTGARFFGADLTNAQLDEANLTGANFVFAKLTGAKFAGANLRGANLGSALDGADLSGADLTAAAR
jgi:uncharacterized protein YjbI with pentapeptide repeats